MKIALVLRCSSVTLWAALGAVAPCSAQSNTPADLLARYAAQAGVPASAERGQAMFNGKFGRDFDNCAACHGAMPTKSGKDLVSEKPIKPLAPTFQPGRFTDRTKVEYQFNLNCKEVIGRVCSAGEKADLMAWLISLKP